MLKIRYPYSLDEERLELLDVVRLIVLVSLPDVLIVLLDDIGGHETHLNEGVDGLLNEHKIHHLVVSVLCDLIENTSSQPFADSIEAMVTEEMQC